MGFLRVDLDARRGYRSGGSLGGFGGGVTSAASNFAASGINISALPG